MCTAAALAYSLCQLAYVDRFESPLMLNAFMNVIVSSAITSIAVIYTLCLIALRSHVE